ncbi:MULTISPECIES: disulfide oxidoreductase [Anoxybacillus]|uniref:Disulfide bond formation protein B n=1 Tax=Anoxybacillus flavithermus TaxID=33934 RepID=A0A178TG73_9BACL|nr:disulfide oxidoreductase [Anoxybacillus flavithermus]ASA96718.1 disulfide bond formation protein B [Anoxybacillus flavithermus]ELK21224.1 disulfide oxidoreductase [Anoxybacillus flavithermus TNO-09.006]MBE2905913.1 disulfide bond formation protein B [Anoxybacillus flavithermus]MBE2908528.1 disulfide bond formation protein B [Anoxybacillus flavithermus]MBE2911337.1 disulfide bond formation protein B [Anoxybacillus flavithermus]
MMHKENYLLAAWSVALVATLGSLYFSEVLKFIPCELCWYQRIFMYPQVFLLGMAFVRKQFIIARYTLMLSIIGGTISLYHYFIQKVPFFRNTAPSCSIVPCTGDYLNWLGFITIPLLALIAFISISVISYRVIQMEKEGKYI